MKVSLHQKLAQHWKVSSLSEASTSSYTSSSLKVSSESQISSSLSTQSIEESTVGIDSSLFVEDFISSKPGSSTAIESIYTSVKDIDVSSREPDALPTSSAVIKNTEAEFESEHSVVETESTDVVSQEMQSSPVTERDETNSIVKTVSSLVDTVVPTNIADVSIESELQNETDDPTAVTNDVSIVETPAANESEEGRSTDSGFGSEKTFVEEPIEEVPKDKNKPIETENVTEGISKGTDKSDSKTSTIHGDQVEEDVPVVSYTENSALLTTLTSTRISNVQSEPTGYGNEEQVVSDDLTEEIEDKESLPIPECSEQSNDHTGDEHADENVGEKHAGETHAGEEHVGDEYVVDGYVADEHAGKDHAGTVFKPTQELYQS
ncbi:uncharacterized protein RJT20DRAFT_132757 [Scheffersomyces xylosifermentans]|uniref:uncharacterized protein n=1 Tax=Scheffersomyces xylosifermentans TaxID=1304137 RepID=UPI00315D6D34